VELSYDLANPLADNAPTDPADLALLIRARSGDRHALEELVQRHHGWIYNIAARMLYHPEDTEDATQGILLKVLARLSAFESQGCLLAAQLSCSYL
jgi:DNA-directed RNA polymerase specialized sigma24 family protein